jgi:hypothetical protein
MATHRIFCYNPTGATISGTEQVGSIAAATGDVSIDPTKQWWNGPDEDVRYIVAYSSLNSERSNGPERVLATNYPCNLGFIGSSAKTDESFLNLAKTISGSSSLASASAAKTWLNTNGYWTSWSIPSFTGLLDTYSGAAAAYSAARRLSSTYTGALIRVRRSSDNAEQDIGYNGSNVLDEAALTSFVGSGNNGFVTTWYDQSGNSKNATQTTAANQPKVYDSSTGVLTENSKPTLKFDGSNDFFSGGDILDFDSNQYFSTSYANILATDSTLFAKTVFAAANSRYAVYHTGGSLIFPIIGSNGSSYGTSYAMSVNEKLYTLQFTNNGSVSTSKIFLNDTEVSSQAVGSVPSLNSTYRFLIGAYNNATDTGQLWYLNGNYSEAIFFLSNQ